MIPKGIERYKLDKTKYSNDFSQAEYPIENDPHWRAEEKRIVYDGQMDAAQCAGEAVMSEGAVILAEAANKLAALGITDEIRDPSKY
jgi:hypothetical protein